MKEKEFVERLKLAFDGEIVADVARRLGTPHATVRNYYLGRLPSAEVLIKIAAETGVSLNWLLLGIGDMYAGDRPPVSIGRFLDEKIAEMIDSRIAELTGTAAKPAARDEFDIAAAVVRLNDPRLIMGEWLGHEGREFPDDYGIVFFNGWETFSTEDKIEAVRDAKRALDRSLKTE